MKYFITGATGFIGTHLCHRLVHNGHEIVALVRNPDKAKGLPKNNVQILQGDLSLFKNKTLELPPCDSVIHMAGLITAKNVREYDTMNYEATVDLVDCLNRQTWKPKRFIFASSVAAAGPTQKGKPKNESDPCTPNEPYGEAKLKTEIFLKNNAPCPITIFRPGVVFGPGDPNLLTVYKMAAQGFGFKVAKLNVEMNYIYVDDLIEAIVKILGDESEKNRTYFAVYDTPCTVDDLWKELSSALNKKITVLPIPQCILFVIMCLGTFLSKIFPFTNKMDIKEYKHVTQEAYTCTSHALQKDFGWKPQNDLASSIKKTLQLNSFTHNSIL